MDAAELLRKVRAIEIRTRGFVNQIFSGEYHSVFMGRGMAFSEVREYMPGDDIRTIDWNVSARFNHPFIKVFEEERELTVILLVDVSGSGEFGTAARLKRETAAELCAVFAFSALKNNDKAGVILFSDAVELFIPPKKGRSHVLRIIREVLDFRPSRRGTGLGEALSFLNGAIRKRSIVFLISDFIDDGYERPLSIAARRHDLVGVRLFDPREESIPDAGLLRVADPESGERRWIDTSSKRVRDGYARWWAGREDSRRRLLRRHGIDEVSIRTDLPYIKPLMGFFRMREKRW
jgi:uncharacterized protein (DUF58 family)